MNKQKYKKGMYDYLHAMGQTITEEGNISCILPSHGTHDSNPSMKIWGTGFKCYKCGEQGDVYDLAGIINNVKTFKEKYEIVEKAIGTGETYTPKILNKKKEKAMEKVAQGVVNLYLKSIKEENMDKILAFAEHRGYGKEYTEHLYYWEGYSEALNRLGYDVLSKTHIYKKTWSPEGVVCAYETGWKLMYLRDGKTEKRASGVSRAFPFPALPEGDSVVLVEGEPCALACRTVGIPAVSIGGTSGFKQKDVKRLVGYKEVFICMDADDAGSKASDKLGRMIPNSTVISLDPEIGKDPDDYIRDGYDDQLKELLKPAPKVEDIIPFKVLGYSDTGHYFMGRNDMITKSPLGKLTSGILLEIAPLSFWSSLKSWESGLPDWTFINDLIISLSIKKGVYKPSCVRGVGVWEDNKEIVVSDGEHIICKAGMVPVKEYKSKYTYIRRSGLGLYSEENPKAKDDFESLDWMCNHLAFSTPEDGKLMFGWIIASLFLAVIPWRPVAYMKGASGVGKSWTMNNIVREILGEMCICPSKMSTVKGVLQAPSYDARMITVDELESSSERSMMEVVRGLMNVARDSTTKNKESRFTGTADQEGQHKDFRSMFMFASIVESSEEDQDVNRITPINFARKENGKPWEEIDGKISYLMECGLGDRIRSNAVFHRDSIIENIKTFKLEASKKVTKQRAADQLGTIIAGWYHLEHSGKVVSREEASEYLESFDFDDQNERGKGKTMETIMSPILSYKIRYEEITEVQGFDSENTETDIRTRTRERTIYSILCELNESLYNGEPITRNPLNKELMNYGIRFGTMKKRDKLVIALNHEHVRNMLPRNFNYRENYFDYFKNHKDFVSKERCVKFNGVVFQAMLFNVDLQEEENEF